MHAEDESCIVTYIKINGGKTYPGYIRYIDNSVEINCFTSITQHNEMEKNGEWEIKNMPETFGGMECPSVRVNRKVEYKDWFTYTYFHDIQLTALVPVSQTEYTAKDEISVTVTNEDKKNWSNIHRNTSYKTTIRLPARSSNLKIELPKEPKEEEEESQYGSVFDDILDNTVFDPNNETTASDCIDGIWDWFKTSILFGFCYFVSAILFHPIAIFPAIGLGISLLILAIHVIMLIWCFVKWVYEMVSIIFSKSEKQ
jgi:hypothetical protein